MHFLYFRLRPKGVGEEGVGEKLNRGFSGFSLGRYVSGTSPVRHDIARSPTFCVLSTFSNRFFPGFNRFFFFFFSGFLKNLQKTWFNFHRPPPWPTPFGGPRYFESSDTGVASTWPGGGSMGKGKKDTQKWSVSPESPAASGAFRPPTIQDDDAATTEAS